MAQIPAFSLCHPQPDGLVHLTDLPVVVDQAAGLLQGRPWIPVLALGYYPGFDATPIVNLYTEPHVRPAKGPDVEFCCAVVLGDAASLRLFEACLRTATGLSADAGLLERRAAAGARTPPSPPASPWSAPS